MLTVNELKNIKGKVVVVRVDFNVPLKMAKSETITESVPPFLQSRNFLMKVQELFYFPTLAKLNTKKLQKLLKLKKLKTIWQSLLLA